MMDVPGRSQTRLIRIPDEPSDDSIDGRPAVHQFAKPL